MANNIAAKGDSGLVRSQSRKQRPKHKVAPPLVGRKTVLMGMAGSVGAAFAGVAHPSTAAAGSVKPLAATTPVYVAKWAPAATYAVGQQVISPNNDVVSASVAHMASAVYGSDSAKWTLSIVDAGAGVNVRTYGAVGDGVTLDQAAINAAITANPGRVIHLTKEPHVAASTYLVDADYLGGKGIRLNQQGTQLVLDPGVTVKVKPNALQRYAAITVTAADCSVIGGAILGDVGAHTGTGGEWGHGIDVQDGGHRFRVQGTYISKCWGDGIIICDTVVSNTTGSKPCDVSIIDVVCDNNRRQGLSIVTALRPRIIGGSFINTGVSAITPPAAGIDIEPNPGGKQDVIDFSIIGCVVQGNAGRGLTVHAQGRTASGTVQGVRSIGNMWEGFSSESTAAVEFVGCTATGNKAYAFMVQAATTGRNVFNGCTADGNSKFGFMIPTWGEAIGCHARNNGWSGFYLSGTGTATACTATGNNTADPYYGQFAVEAGSAVRLVGCVSSVGTNTAKPNKGFDVKAGSTGTRLISCDTIGTFTSGAFVNGGTATIAFPVPGVPKPTGVAVTAAGVHAALVSLGFIS
jgi:Pectate lyase superfamily protein